MSLIPFTFEDHSVRVIDRGGDPWFVLGDVCAVLEIANARDAASGLDDDEKGVGTADTLGGPQEVTIVNESGLWSLETYARADGTEGARTQVRVTPKGMATLALAFPLAAAAA